MGQGGVMSQEGGATKAARRMASAQAVGRPSVWKETSVFRIAVQRPEAHNARCGAGSRGVDGMGSLGRVLRLEWALVRQHKIKPM